ncbi:MAG: hypothetical protein SGILL_001890 [Bacillariaceae sp.]
MDSNTTPSVRTRSGTVGGSTGGTGGGRPPKAPSSKPSPSTGKSHKRPKPSPSTGKSRPKPSPSTGKSRRHTQPTANKGTMKTSTGNRRKGVSMEVCKVIRGKLQSNPNQKTCKIDGKKYYLECYSISPTAIFGLDLDKSLLFNGLPVLPIDHPEHDEHVKAIAIGLLPSCDLLLDSGANEIQKARDLLDGVKKKIDVDPLKLSKFPFGTLVVTAMKVASKQKKVANADSKQAATNSPLASITVADLAASQQNLTNTMAASMSSLATHLTNLTGNVAGCAKAIGDNTTAIANLTDNVAGNTTAIGENTTAIGENTTAIGNLTDNVAGNTTAIGELTRKAETLAEGQNQLGQRVTITETDIGVLKTQVNDLTMSARKASRLADDVDPLMGMGRRLDHFYDTTPSASPAASPLRTVNESTPTETTDLSDISTLESDYFMKQFQELLCGNPDLSSTTTEWQQKNLQQFKADLGRSSLDSMKSDFDETEAYVLNGDASTIVNLESLTALCNGLGQGFLAIHNPENSHDGVFLLTGECHVFVGGFLSCTGGAEVLISIDNDDDISMTLVSRTAAAATEALSAILQLAGKGTKSLEFEISSLNDMDRGDPKDLPLPDEQLGLVAPFELSLTNCVVSTRQHGKNLADNFTYVRLDNCIIGDDAAEELAEAADGNRTLKTIYFSQKKSPISASPFAKLVKQVCQAQGNTLKLVFGSEAIDGLPGEALQEMSTQIASALVTARTLTSRIEMDSQEALRPAFKGVVEKSLQIAIQNGVGINNPVMLRLRDEGTLPIELTGLKAKMKTFADKVKAMWEMADDSHSADGKPPAKKARVAQE